MDRLVIQDYPKLKIDLADGYLKNNFKPNLINPTISATANNRAQYLEERRRMMLEWADYLDTLKKGATSVSDF